jgi:hypothetical protein
MALDLTLEQKALGRANFNDVTGELTRRGFMKSMVAAGGAVAVASAAGYYGYQKLNSKPIKAALIGTTRSSWRSSPSAIFGHRTSNVSTMVRAKIHCGRD